MPDAKILMIDDDPEDQMIMQETLEAMQQEGVASFAANGEQALTILNSLFISGKIPNLIILDLNMPLMNGTSTLQRLKEDARFHDIPVIIYSTSVNPFEKEKCMSLGAHSYITKPISIEESVTTAETFLSFCA